MDCELLRRFPLRAFRFLFCQIWVWFWKKCVASTVTSVTEVTEHVGVEMKTADFEYLCTLLYIDYLIWSSWQLTEWVWLTGNCSVTFRCHRGYRRNPKILWFHFEDEEIGAQVVNLPKIAELEHCPAWVWSQTISFQSPLSWAFGYATWRSLLYLGLPLYCSW